MIGGTDDYCAAESSSGEPDGTVGYSYWAVGGSVWSRDGSVVTGPDVSPGSTDGYVGVPVDYS